MVTKKIIGRQPINFGQWYAKDGGWGLKNRVNYFGSEFESKEEGNTEPPAILNAETDEVIFNTEKWEIISNGTDAWLASRKIYDLGHYDESGKYVRVILDAEGKLLIGLQKDGYCYIPFINNSVINFLNSYFSELIRGSAKWMKLIVDSNGKILEGFRSDGTKIVDTDVIFKNISLDGIKFKNFQDNRERLEILLDSNGKVISYRRKDGTKVECAGFSTPVMKANKVLTDSLQLSDDGMTEFQQALKDSGFNPGGVGDFSDKEYMYIPEPRLAHLNIITDFDLTTLGQFSNVSVILEFCDNAGNYFKKYGILNAQGRSSLGFIKKGLGLDFFNENPSSPDFDEDNVFSMKFGNWVAQDSFHIKSFYTDFPRCTCPVVYKIAYEVVSTRGIMEDRPYKKYYVGEYSDGADRNSQGDLDKNMETGARCISDGFPVIVYHNGEFWGVNSWQLKKHRDNYMLSKKKATHIHLDGDMGKRTFPSAFWNWNGTIDWNHYCNGTYGIETRNPKNLYCIDGKKYDADTHDVEIITSATAEEWIAAGQIIPTGKTIDDTLAGYLRTTGKVRKSIEDLTTYVPYINNLIEGGATTADIKAAIEDRFDVDSFIDYILINNVVSSWDAWDNNGQIITWGKLDGSSNLHWSVNIWDSDLTFGIADSDGKIANPADSTKYGSTFTPYKFFWDYYYDELKERYKELRDKGIFDKDHITKKFRDWMDRVGYENYEKEFNKWPESPCFRDGNRDDYTMYPYTGGFYGSIERIYLWIKKRIELMDAQDFFDYNQN